MRCDRYSQAPAVSALPKKSPVKAKSQEKILPPAVQAPVVPVFTLKDFDSNNTDHRLIREAIGRELGKPAAALVQEDLGQVKL